MSRSSKEMTLINYFSENQEKDKKFTLKTGMIGAGLGCMLWVMGGESRSKAPVYLFIFTGSILLMTVKTVSNLYHAWKTFPEEKKYRERREQRYRAVLEYKQGADNLLNEVKELLVEKREVVTRLSQPIEEFKYTNSNATAIDKTANAMQEQISEDEIINKGWKCVITQQIFRDPVKAKDGFFYERHALQRWYDLGKRVCIINREMELSNPKTLVTDLQMQNEILHYLFSLNSISSLKSVHLT